jgi:hypothetical protein
MDHHQGFDQCKRARLATYYCLCFFKNALSERLVKKKIPLTIRESHNKLCAKQRKMEKQQTVANLLRG